MRMRPTPTIVTALALALVAASCEDTPLLVPNDGQILVDADPDEAEPRTADPSGQTLFSTIEAVVLSVDGAVLPGRQVTFTRSGGVLCVAIADCLQPGSGAPIVLETDQNGVARVVLAVTNQDSITVDVTARSGNKQQSVTVSNPIGELPDDPVIEIDAPAAVACDSGGGNECIYGLTVALQAVVVTESPQPINCYQWRLTPSDETNETTAPDPDEDSITRTYALEQQLGVTLLVADGAPACDDSTTFTSTADLTLFVCNNQPPNAVIAPPEPSTAQSLIANGGMVTFTLKADGTTDPDGTPATSLTYQWDCGSTSLAPQQPTGAEVQCKYNTTGSKTVQLTVRDSGAAVSPDAACGRSDTASTTLSVTS